MSRLHLFVAYAALATGCASWLPTPVPMRTVASRLDPEKQARCLLVLLPGRGDSEKDFVDHGFIDDVRARKLPVDVIAAGATLGYYARRTLHERLREDVLAPARAAGYTQIWLAGISMGGLGSLLLAKDGTVGIAGIILLAPYLGDRPLIEEIAQAGGLVHWEPGTIKESDYQRELWRWLKRATEPGEGPPMYLGAGDRDRLAMSHGLLGDVLPAARVYHTSGGHDWSAWSVLWRDFLDHSDFRARCEAAAPRAP